MLSDTDVEALLSEFDADFTSEDLGPKKCDCHINTLMAYGCQCGGV